MTEATVPFDEVMWLEISSAWTGTPSGQGPNAHSPLIGIAE